jgi:FtsH-binding integral membrane protein
MLESMNFVRASPILLFFVSLVVLWLAERIGSAFRKPKTNLDEDARHDLDLIVNSTLTLLGLIIGFSFSMAISRYDQRKGLEEGEANAIGTEFVRADLLPAANATRVRALLREYLAQRVLFYETRDKRELRQINDETARLQNELWSAVRQPAEAQPTAMMGLALSGMNDVLNAQGYTQAAWWNRIPVGAWCLMAGIAVCACLLVGYSARLSQTGFVQFFVMPLVLSIAFAFIADIDSPRSGLIKVHPQNLISLVQSLRGQ